MRKYWCVRTGNVSTEVLLLRAASKPADCLAYGDNGACWFENWFASEKAARIYAAKSWICRYMAAKAKGVVNG
jgi:hypothetical protein